MTRRPIALAYADEGMAAVVRAQLIKVGEAGRRIERTVLRDRQEVLDWLRSARAELLVLDAELSERGEQRRDPTGDTALTLLKERQNFGHLVPTLVLTKVRNNESELEAFCTPANRAIALPEANAHPNRAAVFSAILGMIKLKPRAAWTAMDILVRDRFCRCELGDGTAVPVVWEKDRTVPSVRQYASRFERRGVFKSPDWLTLYDWTGRVLFEQHVVNSLGRGLFAHIANAAGGLTGLAFRFKIDDVQLYSVPFEASVWVLDEDPDKSEFVILHAPVVRWLPTGGTLRTNRNRSGGLPSPIKMLFVRSQMGEHPDGESVVDRLELSAGESLSFRKLHNIDVELESLVELGRRVGKEQLDVRVVDLSKDCEPGGSATYLESVLKGEHFDIVHFAGHSWSSTIDTLAKTVLVLPGAEPGRASKMAIEDFAQLAGLTEARLVYLSSCEGSSARSVLSLVRHGVPHALGFRCDVEDDKAAKFAGDFYETLFRPASICTSFRNACSAARRALKDGDLSPIWASPILVAQTDDWAMRA